MLHVTRLDTNTNINVILHKQQEYKLIKEKQEAAWARWEHQSAAGIWTRDPMLFSDWSGSSN